MKFGKIPPPMLGDYFSIFDRKADMHDYKSYYRALSRFVVKYEKEFSCQLLKEWGLDILVKMDPEIYVVQKPEVTLSMEKKRLVRDYSSMEVLAMSITDTMWDLVTIYSGKMCPNNPEDDELRYVHIDHSNCGAELLLRCFGCGWIWNLDGIIPYEGELGMMAYPASIDEVKGKRCNE